MTREDEINYIKNSKIYVKDRSADIQKALFSLGFCWVSGDTLVKNTNQPYLYIDENMKITHGNTTDGFYYKIRKELDITDILNFRDKTYKPFFNEEECMYEMKKHEPFGWVKYIHDGSYILIERISRDGVFIKNSCIPYDELLHNFVFVDNSHFGINGELCH